MARVDPVMPPLLNVEWDYVPLLLLLADEFGELARFVQNSGCVTSVGVIIFHQHSDHVGSQLIGTR